MRAMTYCGFLLLACVLGCGTAITDELSPQDSERRESNDESNQSNRDKPEDQEAPPENKRPRGTAGVDWPAFLGLTGDSKSTETGILTDWPENGPPIMWQMRIGEGYGAPSISGDWLYLFDRHRDQQRLTCLDRQTGKERWRFEYATNYDDLLGYSGGPRCCPVIDGELVYIYGPEGMLHCLRVMDGEPVWKLNTMKEFNVVQNFFGVGSAPVVEGDLLIVQVGGSPSPYDKTPDGKELPAPPNVYVANGDVKSNSSAIVALDKRTGEVKYQIGDELASYAVPVLATIDKRRWCFAFVRGGLLGFDPTAGKVAFHFPWRATSLESVNASNPVVVDNRVFISETYGPGSAMLEIKDDGYEVAWQDEERSRRKAMQTHWNTPIYHEGYLYGCSGRHTENADLRCIDWKTGKVMWTEPGTTRCSLMYVDGHFVSLGEYGDLTLIKADPKKFTLVAESVLPDKEVEADPFNPAAARLLKYPCWAAPVLSHGLLYLRGSDRLVCLELIPRGRP